MTKSARQPSTRRCVAAAASPDAGRVEPRGPTILALQHAIAGGEIDRDIDVDMAMHIIQGPLISMRIIAMLD